MKVLAIQHDAADPPAAAGEIVQRLGHELRVIRMDRGDAIPKTVDADMLMSFGGGVSLSGDRFPDWVAEEQTLMRKYIDADRRILGVCLGGQMIAAALGETVRRNEHVELGWHAITRTEAAQADFDWLADSTMVLHWHQDTFAIPAGATHLFRSVACENQGFAIGNRIFALQFHLEATEHTVQTFNRVSPLRRREGEFVQSEERVMAGIDTYLAGQTALLESLLRNLLN
tara:strand:+ start:58470 stop:59156 length:687 start_codon:yes stop_codon:yes gene_type:complete